ncbi:hypothetical protein Hanom_Chr11g00986781 [Helianthus anomalus]
MSQNFSKGVLSRRLKSLKYCQSRCRILTPYDGESIYDNVGRNVMQNGLKRVSYVRLCKSLFGENMQHLAAIFLSNYGPRTARRPKPIMVAARDTCRVT